MEDRIGFKFSEARKEFFQAARASITAKSWKETWAFFGIPKTNFQNYLYGKHLMPKGQFEKIASNLSVQQKEYFSCATFSKSMNWGAAEGGKALYKKHPELFEKWRKNGYEKARASGFGIPRKIDSEQPLSKELCEFVGAFIGDGCLSGGKTIGIAGDCRFDRAYFDYLSKKVYSLFGLDGKILKRKYGNGIHLLFNSVSLCSMFVERFNFPKGPKADCVVIPDEILNAKEEYLFSTVRGIFDTDGCVFFDKRKLYTKPYPRICLQVNSKELVGQLAVVLRKHFMVSNKKCSKRNAYYLEIYGHKQFERWMRLIGFSNEKHLARIKKASGGN